MRIIPRASEISAKEDPTSKTPIYGTYDFAEALTHPWYSLGTSFFPVRSPEQQKPAKGSLLTSRVQYFRSNEANTISMRLIFLLAAAAILLTPWQTRSASYADQDALLVFRSDGYNNVEFNLGSVSQFLSHTNGYQAKITNWSQRLVNANFALTNCTAQFFILSTTSGQDPAPRAWVTDAQPLIAASDVTLSQWKSLFSLINGVGQGLVLDPNAPPNTNADVISPLTRYAFDYIASNGLQTPNLIPYLGGGSGLKFRSSGTVPGTVLFYEVKPSSIIPKPPAQLIGSFSLSADGQLVFQAGPLIDTAQISSVVNNTGAVAITFNSKPAVKYRLRYNSQPNTPPSAWTIASGSVVGDGNPQTLTDNSGGDAARFYLVESYQ